MTRGLTKTSTGARRRKQSHRRALSRKSHRSRRKNSRGGGRSKRQKTPYIKFASKMFKVVRRKNPRMSFEDVGRTLGKMWRHRRHGQSSHGSSSSGRRRRSTSHAKRRRK